VNGEQMGAYPVVEHNQAADAAAHARQLTQLRRAHVLLAEGLVARLVVGHLHLVLFHDVIAHGRKVEGDVLVADLAPAHSIICSFLQTDGLFPIFSFPDPKLSNTDLDRQIENQ